jgi:protein SMG6
LTTNKSLIFSAIVVVTELDGLAKQRSVLGPAAKSAVQYLETNVKTMARSLKIQTAKGNYLNNLTIRSEMIEVATGTNSEGLSLHERTMDDFILRVAAAQSSNFIDRSHILQNDSDLATDAVKNKKAPKVVFLTLDRNLRLRARARGLEAASEKEMAKIFGSS